ncbi:MAG TPA: aldo/keto reductase [Gemmatimonadaceae bacterium]|nr:aldo/keto reductase [Gemmatimonadaceae bacterium]
MEQVEVTGTGITMSRIGLGTWAIGGYWWGGGSDDAQAVRTIHAALDRGITLIDTAPVYGFGHAEQVVGAALAGGHRQRAIVATKAGLRWSRRGVTRDSSRAALVREVDDSLRRLRTDRIDIYQLHWPDARTPVDETADTLLALHRAGKIRAIGVSNFSPAQMDAFRAAAPLHTAQPPYNVFERAAERDVLPYCAQHGITTLTYGALCRGLLSGRMRRDTTFPKDDLRATDPRFRAPRYAQYVAAVEELDRLARERFGHGVLQLAVRWVLDQPGVGSALWGARRPEQLDPVEGVMGWSLDDDARRAVVEIVERCVRDPVGPEFMAPPESGQPAVARV